MAREVIFWPGLRKSIQDTCDAGSRYAQYGTTAPKEPMKYLPMPTRLWQIDSQDIFTLDQQNYLVNVCHFSDWIKVDKLEDTYSSTVIEKIKAYFARYGVPKICHTDNGLQFISQDYKYFSTTYRFQHTTSSYYHPKDNGRAVAAVEVDCEQSFYFPWSLSALPVVCLAAGDWFRVKCPQGGGLGRSGRKKNRTAVLTHRAACC
jgi:hypothetical protein